MNRQKAWVALMDAERLARYYAKLSSRMTRRFHMLNGVIGGGSVVVAGLASIGVQWQSIIAIISIIVALAAFWAIQSNYSKKAIEAAIISDKCSKIVIKLKDLWREQDTIADDIARETLNTLEEELHSVASATVAASAQLPEDERLNQKSATEAYGVIVNEFS